MSTPDEEKALELKIKKWRRHAVLFGMVLALICKSLPPQYHAVCDTFAQLCRGGF